MPTTAKQKADHRYFNLKNEEPLKEVENELFRSNKRRLKENYKQVSDILKQRAGFLPINMFLEDFYYLKGCNKNGILQKRTLQ